MPIREYICLDCSHQFEEIVHHGQQDPACPHCADGDPEGGHNVERLISAPGNYAIHGNNSASTRPRGGGSFRKGAKK